MHSIPIMKSQLKNGMLDWLEIVNKAGGEAAWVTQQKNFPKRNGKRQKPKDSNEIIEMILKTEFVQKVIREECAKRNTTRKLLSDEARLILCSIAHEMQMLVIRSVGYVIAKTVRIIYNGIYFNDEQLLRIRECSIDDPIIFMPTHRSYMDFLVVSLLCFNHNLSLPVIATGLDFMASRFLGETLRRCGSFFMKRQFREDKLYWSLFSSYVQMQLRETDNPVEFFLEGTRSRSGKSLYPKFGLLQMCMEPFFRCQLYDLIVVPVTIDYDKVLEEFLYAYELFGFPKPRETTAGLFKSREILSKCFGHIYVNFGEPVSIRKYFDGRINRWHPPWQASVDNELSDNEKEAVKNFGLYIIQLHNLNSTTTIWSYTCAVLLQMKSAGHKKLMFSKLQSSLEDFVTLSKRLGRRIIIRKSIKDDLRYHLKLHSDLFQYDALFPNSLIELRRFKCIENNGLKKEYIEKMLCEVILSYYANQMMHGFVDISLLCHVLLSIQMLSRANHIFRELRSLFVYEFVCSLQEEEIDKLFAESLSCLLRISAISLDNDHIIVEEEQILKQIALLMQPFIARYYCVMQCLVQLVGTQFTNEVLFEESLQLAVNLFARQQGNSTSRSVCITSDITRNALLAFCRLQAICRRSEREYDVNIYRVQRMMGLLESTSMAELPFDKQSFVSKI
uniref:PlsC domain-containing protein n=3 Tax=Brugia TaxID=6278 RepID=A0A5S6PT56_BRUMA